MKLEKLTLATVANGSALELFARELGVVLENIEDCNTKPEATREISLKFVFKPDVYRKSAVVLCEAKSKIVPVNAAFGTVHLGKTNGKIRAYTNDIDQMELEMTEPPKLAEEENSNVS